MLKQRQDAYSLVSDDFLQTVKESNVKEGGRDLRFICNVFCCMKLVVRTNFKIITNPSDDFSYFKSQKLFKIKALVNCRFTVFLVVDCRFSQFFVDVDFYLKSGCRCRLNGLKSCNLHFAGPPYGPPLRQQFTFFNFNQTTLGSSYCYDIDLI